jgi:hypothetical protein
MGFEGVGGVCRFLFFEGDGNIFMRVGYIWCDVGSYEN